MGRLLVGVLISAGVAWLAWRRGALSTSGAVAASGVGAAIFGGGGAVWFAALGAFFVSSTLLGRVGAAHKARTKREFEKGDTRDAWQVLANGGVAAAAAMGMILWPDPRWIYCFAGALGAANGDTWATELGILSRREPRSILTLRRVARGTSGAISPLGLGATVGGALLVGLVAALGAGAPWHLIGATVVAGTLGSLADSAIGATVQESFYCDACARLCEAPQHHCGARAERRRGLPGFGNDAVNLVATLVGAGVGALLGF